MDHTLNLETGTRKTKKGWLRSFILDNEYSYLVIAFFLPLIIMWAIFIAMEVYPFGNNSVLVLDLNGQYVYFFEAIRGVFKGDFSILYSWSRALGGEFMGIFGYYVASPFALLTLLFPASHITEALLCMMLLKVGACGFTFAFYLHKTHYTQKNKIVIFSTMYALTSYAVVYGHNTMWIDALILLPLILFGMEELISKGKFKLYTITLAIAVFSNFYIGYMICIFLVFYFFYYYFSKNYEGKNNALGEKNHFLKAFLRVLFFSVIAIIMTAVLLLSVWYSLGFGKTTFSNPSYAFGQKFDFLDMLTKMLPGSYDTVRPTGLPMIYCGVLSLMIMPLYFLSSKFKAREKAWGGALLAFLIFSFNSTTIDLIWHGMQKPNWLNYRYSFIFCFFVILFAYKAFDALSFESRESLNYKYVIGMAGILVVLLMIIQKMEYEHIDDLNCIWVTLICIGVYLVALHPVSKGYLKASGATIVAILMCMEMFSAGLMNITALDDDVVVSSRTSYVSFMNKVRPITEMIQEDDTSFYRMEKTLHRKTNDNMALGIRGLSNSTSTLNSSTIEFLNQMGYSSKSHWSKYLGGTPVSDALLGLKYTISDDEMNEEIYEKKYTDEYTDSKGTHEVYGYYNPYYQSIAYGVNEGYEIIDPDYYDSPFELMNDMVSAMLGEDVMLFVPAETEMKYDNVSLAYTTGHRKFSPKNSDDDAVLNYVFKAEAGKDYYLFFPSNYPREVALKLKSIGTFFANETDRIVSLGDFKEDGEPILTVTLKKSDLYIIDDAEYIYYLDTEVYKQAMEKLQESSFEITDYTEDHLIGTIHIEEGRETVFTSIPYDEGWNIYLDGEKVEIFESMNSLITFKASAGEHTLEMKYLPEITVKGFFVSLGGILIFLVVVLVDFIVKKRKARQGVHARMESQIESLFRDASVTAPMELTLQNLSWDDVLENPDQQIKDEKLEDLHSVGMEENAPLSSSNGEKTPPEESDGTEGDTLR